MKNLITQRTLYTGILLHQYTELTPIGPPDNYDLFGDKIPNIGLGPGPGNFISFDRPRRICPFEILLTVTVR